LAHDAGRPIYGDRRFAFQVVLGMGPEALNRRAAKNFDQPSIAGRLGPLSRPAIEGSESEPPGD